MTSARLRDPYEISLYTVGVLVNLLIIDLILAGALLLGFANALVGEPLSGPVVDAIRVAFAASTFGYDFVVIHSELFSNTYEKNKDALAFIIGHDWASAAWAHEALVPAFDRVRRSGSPAGGIPLAC